MDHSRPSDTRTAPRLSAMARMIAWGAIALLAAQRSDAQTTHIVLHRFAGGTDGTNPNAGLFLGPDGNLYGTTAEGGTSGKKGAGTVFKLDPATGVETVVYRFGGSADGGIPYASLIADAEGNFYGTTASGGDLACNGGKGCGAVFKLDHAGNETVLYGFSGSPDGDAPQAGVIRDASGNLYGTTVYDGFWGQGIVFRVDATGRETIVHQFRNVPDGSTPIAGLILDAGGNLYGTTDQGGEFAWGEIFRLDKNGQRKKTTLYSFTGGADGARPQAALIQDPQGNFYGTTLLGGSGIGFSGYGTVFKLDATTGVETVLHTFSNRGSDGQQPNAALIRDAEGNLYGTTEYGGAFGYGTVFKLDPTGIETVLYSFSAGMDGAFPIAGLVRDATGNLYGTTVDGGLGPFYGYGTVFELTFP